MERLARAANYISSPLLPPSRFLWDHNCQWEGERGRFRHARGRPIVLRITFLRVGRLPWYQRLWPKYSRRWGFRTVPKISEDLRGEGEGGPHLGDRGTFQFRTFSEHSPKVFRTFCRKPNPGEKQGRGRPQFRTFSQHVPNISGWHHLPGEGWGSFTGLLLVEAVFA